MSNLNLATGTGEETRGPRLFNKSFVLSLVILILVLAIWGGLIAGQKYLDSKLAAAQTQYQSGYQKFLAGNAKEVADFNNRLQIANALLKNRADMGVYLSAMEKDLVPPAYLTSFKYDDTKNTLTVDGVADNYNTVAKQILSFKNDTLFSSVVPGNSNLSIPTQSGSGTTTTSGPPQIDFSIILGVK
jgi:Tfp pilus assembly protein PilN